MKPKISLIIPVYNVEKYISKALDSVFNQTFSGIEIICVDDCSPDGSLEILKSYKEKSVNSEKIVDFKIIELKENKGQGHGRNLALTEATGDYIMYLDPDDWYELNAFEKAYNQIVKNNNDFVCFDFYMCYEADKTRLHHKERHKPFENVINSPSIRIRDVDADVVVENYCWTAIYKCDFLVNNNIVYAETVFAEDQIFMLKAFLLSESVSWITEPLYNYRKLYSADDYREKVLDQRRKNIQHQFNNMTIVSNMLIDAGSLNLLNSYAVYCINVCYRYVNSKSALCMGVPKEVNFQKSKELISLYKQHGVPSKYKEDFDNFFYKKILWAENVKQYQIITAIEQILSRIFCINVETTRNTKKLVVNILGLKFAKTIKKMPLEKYDG